MFPLIPPTSLSNRRYDLDWLRVIAFSILILYHVGMFFNYWDWHIKNNELSHDIEIPMRFSSQWRMALLFMISGSAVFLALRKRTWRFFLKERLVRILLPLIFGMMVIVPPQIYIERLTQGATYSFFDFYGLMLDFQPYPEGNFSWHHLWYLAYILTYTVVGLPLLLLLKEHPLALERLAWLSGRPLWLIGIPVLWHWCGEMLLGGRYPTTNDLVHDWNQNFHYFSLFITGFVFCSHILFWKNMLHARRLTLVISIVLTSILCVVYWVPNNYPQGWEKGLYALIATTNAWCVLLAIFGYGYRYLNFSNRFLDYANEAVYPFYILHQTVIICLAYPLLNLELPVWTKFAYLVVATFVICLVIYQYFIKRVAFLRMVFGMKPLESKIIHQTSLPRLN